MVIGGFVCPEFWLGLAQLVWEVPTTPQAVTRVYPAKVATSLSCVFWLVGDCLSCSEEHFSNKTAR